MFALRLLAALATLAVIAHAQTPPPPPFLAGQAPAVVEAFDKVLAKGDDLTDSQLDKEVEAWVNTQDAQIKVRKSKRASERASERSKKVCQRARRLEVVWP